MNPCLPTALVESRTAGAGEWRAPVRKTDGPKTDKTIICHAGWQESLLREGLSLED